MKKESVRLGVTLLILVILTFLFQYYSGKEIAFFNHRSNLAQTSSSATISRPALPVEWVDTSMPPQTGATINVATDCGSLPNCVSNLQTALTNAKPGDTLILKAGDTFTGNFTIPVKSGNGTIVIKTSAESSLPVGVRVNPNNASSMPKLVSPNAGETLIISSGVKNIRLIGLEITENSSYISDGLPLSQGLVKVGTSQTNLSQQPDNIIFDRVYVHGYPNHSVKRGIALNASRAAVIDSYISDIHGVGQDTQAIWAANGSGPFKITNNYLEAAAENVMFGGADPTIPNVVPTDIEIRGNYFFKPLSWKNYPTPANHWTVKNIFELKSARRVLVDGNIFENSWADGQTGFAISFKTTNQDGACTWCVVEHVTFTNNIIKNSVHGINMCKSCGNPGVPANNFYFGNNTFELSTTEGNFYQTNGVDNVTIDHNTILHGGSLLVADGAPSQNFVYINNIAAHNTYGVKGRGTLTGNPTLTSFFPGVIFSKNILAGGQASLYPATNFFPTTLNGVLSGNRLSGSTYKGVGTDGKDLGADIDTVISRTANVVSGGSTTSYTPPPPSVTVPVVPVVPTTPTTPVTPATPTTPTPVTPTTPTTPITPVIPALENAQPPETVVKYEPEDPRIIKALQVRLAYLVRLIDILKNQKVAEPTATSETPVTISSSPSSVSAPPTKKPASPSVSSETLTEILPSTFSTNDLVSDHGTLYFIRGGTKIPFSSLTVFKALGYSLDNVVRGDTSKYRSTAPEYVLDSTDLPHPWGSWIRINKLIYYSTPEGLLASPDPLVFASNGGKTKYVVQANAADIDILKNQEEVPMLRKKDARVRF